MRTMVRSSFAVFFLGVALTTWASNLALPAGEAAASAQSAVGWIVGAVENGYGLILNTTNGGATWARQGTSPSIPAADLQAVAAIDPSNAWVVGQLADGYSVILRTTDGGVTWIRQGSPGTIPNISLYGVFAVDRQTAWAAGEQGAILHTTDGGATWTLQTDLAAMPNAQLEGTYAADSNNVWVVGISNTDTNGLILHTTNGGLTWARQSYTPGGPIGECYLIHVRGLNAQTVWIVGRSTIARTDNGGATWILQKDYPGDINGIYPVNSNVIFAVADYNAVFSTTNGGADWDRLASEATNNPYLLRIAALDAHTAVAVGGDAHSGAAIVCTTNGQQWLAQEEGYHYREGLSYLDFAIVLTAPGGVSATEGIYTNKIRVSWQSVFGAASYQILRNSRNDVGSAVLLAELSDSSLTGYDDDAVNQVQAYYYWVRAKMGSAASPLSYVGMGYASLSPEEATGTADIAASDLVFLPVNMTNTSTADTVSCRVLNNGPDAVRSEIGFDFYMAAAVAGVADPGAAISDRGYSCPAAVAGFACPHRYAKRCRRAEAGLPAEAASAKAGPGATTPVTEAVWIGSDQGTYTLASGQETLVILTPQARRGLTARADLSGVQQVKVTVRHLSALNDPNLTNNTATGPGTVLVRTAGVNSPGRAINDYDGDGKSDVALCRADKGVWAAILSGTRGSGTTGIEPALEAGQYWTAAGDYDGDGLLDYGLYEETSGYWWILKSSDDQTIEGQLGGTGFRPVSADYDGDGKTDPAVYGSAWGYWEGRESGSNYAPALAWAGGPDYEPVVADYDGDGKADEMAYREVDGHWMGLLSGQGYAPVDRYFGGTGCRAGAADFDGDGLADPMLYQESDGLWQVQLSTGSGEVTTFILGGRGYVAAPGDFDGDGRADPGVYSEQGGAWYGWLSGHDYEWSSARFGGPTYQPVSE